MFIAGILIAMLALPAAAAPKSAEGQMLDKAGTVIADWPDDSRRTAETMIQKYGVPNAIGDRVLVWNGNAPWKRTVVHREDPGLYPRRPGALQQVVDYEVPARAVSKLEDLGAGLSVSHDRRELSASNESEAQNFLAMNLADDVIAGRLSAAQARESYARTLALRESGKTSPTTEKLGFTPPMPARGRGGR